jgi:hypothetical protein
VTACEGPALPVGGHAGTVSFCIHSYTKTRGSSPRPRGESDRGHHPRQGAHARGDGRARPCVGGVRGTTGRNGRAGRR